MIDDDFDWYMDNVVVPGGAPKATNAQDWQVKWRAAAEAAARDPLVREAVELARQQGFVLTHAQARAVGLTCADLRRLVRRGIWTAPRRNVLCVLPRPSTPDRLPHGLRPEIAASAVALVRPSTAASHESAAAMYGLPLLRDPARPILTALEANGGGQGGALVHAAAVHPDEVRRWFGASVLSVARTVVDIARNSGAEAGLVVADAALRDELVTFADLVGAVARASGWPGNQTARRIVELASPGAESPLESLSRLVIADAGLPVPDLQQWVHTAGGSFRVDGLWPDRMVILECDGMLKYRSSDPDQPDPLVTEKRRQEFLERAGYRVVRVTWDDVRNHPVETIRRIVEALRDGGPGLRRRTALREPASGTG